MKKLLALLIAVMMVVALVPATVLSAIVPAIESLGDSNGGGDSNTPAGTTPAEGGVSVPAEELTYDDTADLPDERLEEEAAATFDKEFTEGVDKLEIVNKDGELVGYFADLPSADKWVRSGDTLRFLADVTLEEAHIFGKDRAAFGGNENLCFTYVIDGNGKTVDYRGSKNYALFFSKDSRNHNITIKNLTVASQTGGIGVYANCNSAFSGNRLQDSGTTGGAMTVALENCKLYANDSYYYVNPDYYTDNAILGTPWLKIAPAYDSPALFSETGNTSIIVRGENTVYCGNDNYAIEARSVATIYDGLFYTEWGDAAVQSNAGSQSRNTQKIVIYGGTFVGERLCAARALNGCQLWIFDGTFVMTGENTTNYTDTACIRTSGVGQSGHVYILGGDFYMDAYNDADNHKETAGAAVYSITANSPAYIAGGRFYHSKDGNAFGGHVINVSRFSEKSTAAVTENDKMTLNVPGSTAKSVEWNYVTSVSFNANTYGATLSENGEVLDGNGDVLFADDNAWHTGTGAEVAILDANGRIVGLLDVDNESDDQYCIHYGTVWASIEDAGVNRNTSLEVKLQNSWYFVPNGGTWRMITDIVSTADNCSTGMWMFHYGPNIDVTVDGNGHLLSFKNTGNYLTFSYGTTDVTFVNITMENPTGRGLQFGNSYCSKQTWTLGDGTIVRAGNGSAIYMCAGTTLNVLEGAALEGCAKPAQTWSSHLVQIRSGATFNLLGGTLKAVTGDTYAGSIFYIVGNGERTVNLRSGKVYLVADTLQALRFRQSDTQYIEMNVTEAVAFYTVDGTPALQPVEGNAAEVSNPGEVPVAYATFAEAMNAVKSGATVKLLRDVRIYGTVVISCDMTLIGNGYTVYDWTATKGSFVFHVKGENANVLFDGLTLVTAFSGIYVSPNEQSQYQDESTATSGNDRKIINVTLNNCKLVTGAFAKDAYDTVNSVGGEASARLLFENDATKGALYQHGESTYVKVTGEDGVYVCSNAEAIVNWGGFLDIYGGFVYAASGTQVMNLRGRQNISATADNQMRSATTAIYGGVFLAGSRIDMSVIRSLRGHSLVIMDGEFIMIEGTDPNDIDRHVIRVSDSNRAGYCYILGGDFYQSSSILPVFGWGLATVAYIRIFGGNFWGNCATGIADRAETAYSFNNNTNGVNAAYGTYIDDGYLVKSYTYTENNRAYPEDTKSDYVRGSGYLYHQCVEYDDAWLEENGYMDEGIAYTVTDSESDTIPTEYYSFELERALYNLGNGGTFTLVHNVTLHQPAKMTKSGEADTDYGFFSRYRPAASHLTFTTKGKSNYYTITSKISAQHFLTLAGGDYLFKDFGMVNTKGGMLKLAEDDMSVTIEGGYYYGFANGVNSIDTNGAKGVTLDIVSGEFEYDGSSYNNSILDLKGDAVVTLGKEEGSKVGPTFNKGSILTTVRISASVTGESGVKLTAYYAKMYDVGKDGRHISIEASSQNYEVTIYDGEYLLTNSSYYNTSAYWPLLQTVDGSKGTLNIYGGSFTREGTGYGIGNGGKMLIIEGDGTLNITGGTFRQNFSNILMSVRSNVVTINLGDPATGTGPDFRGNGNVMLSADTNFTTTMTMNIYGGTYYGNKGGIVGIGKSSGVTGVLNIYGGEFIHTSSSVAAFDAGHGMVNFYNGTLSSTGSSGGAFTATGAGSVNLYGGTYTTTNKLFGAVKDATFNAYGGDYNITGDFLSCGDYSGGSFTLNVGMRDGSSGPTIYAATIVSTPTSTDTNQTAANVNIYAGDMTAYTHILCWYGSYGSVNIYGGSFLMLGTTRLMRFGGNFNGEINIYGGIFDSQASDCLAIADNASARITLGKPDGTGPVFKASKDSAIEVTTTGKVNMVIYGGSYTTTAKARTLDWNKSGADSTLLIESGSFYQNHSNCSSYDLLWFAPTDGKGTATINGGSFYANNNADACFTVAAGTCTVNGGYYSGNGMCTIRVLGGAGTAVDADYNKGYITTPSTARLIINGGFFLLNDNWLRTESDSTKRHDAVLRAGGGTGYGTVEINGGTFVNANSKGSRVITKINPTSSIKITGGIFMAGANDEWYFYSEGNLYNANGTMMNEWADPATIAVDPTKDQSMTYNGTSYYMYAVGSYGQSYHKVTDKAEIRLMKIDLGGSAQYISGMRFTTTVSSDAINEWAERLTEMGATSAASEGAWGTIIVPADFLSTLNGSLTHESLASAGLDYLDIAADKSLVRTDDGVSFTAAITDIKEENYGRRFVAVGYMMLEVTVNGEAQTVYFYTDYDATGTSLAELATYLLEREVNNAESSYSAELKALLQSFADALPEDTTPVDPDAPKVDEDNKDDIFGNGDSQESGDDVQDPDGEGQGSGDGANEDTTPDDN